MPANREARWEEIDLAAALGVAGLVAAPDYGLETGRSGYERG
ncbi:MAG TPA: hypothetical protein P5121_24940 [Caldilineaceae bacterium]|nr:hypothetical protein [Caldilineaceae bacterium]